MITMSGFITSTGENYVLDLICRATVAPQEYWIALVANDEPTKFTTGEGLDEPDVPEYQRIPYPNASGNWSERTGEMSNVVTVSFPELSGNEAWPTIRYWGILDAPSGGNLLWAGSFDSPVTLEEGDILSFPPGFLTLRTASYLSRVSL